MTGIEMLREYAHYGVLDEDCEHVPKMFGKKCIDFESCSDCHIFVWGAIADKIERETKRTCRNLSNDGDVFVCSECRNETHGFMFDDFGCTVGFGLGVGRCPNCGAKVVR